MSLNANKELPSLSKELSTPTGARSTPLTPSSTGGRVNMEPPHPTLVLEKFPSFAELALISSWHDATAARQVRFQRRPAPDDCRRSFPPPMSEAKNLASYVTPRTQGLSIKKQLVDVQKLEEKEPKTSKPTRSQNVFDIRKAERTTPNLNATANAGTRKISRSVRFAPCETTASPSTPTNSTNAPVDALDGALHALGIDVNDGNIYFTFDPDCISSCGEAVLTFLSPIPHEPSNSPESPPQHRSLSEVQFEHRSAISRDTTTRARMQPVNELQSLLGVEIELL
ncbi:uncharacterized protein HD556DRAFT_473804 [Suillus plorans]|uniref:Uncharacterized protein n=1 Tax=Suillus plorans TaxID=116603 RepID=A0A9P7DWL2_9AGAM|nr:uncharacterized protein HD556DRAFT_473804 [Suillus plorans]KAG1804729.1 hypothetical protein HD556DRAFT_473804 [Suillus plorans]